MSTETTYFILGVFTGGGIALFAQYGAYKKWW